MACQFEKVTLEILANFQPDQLYETHEFCLSKTSMLNSGTSTAILSLVPHIAK
jgi:hypothetical protein